MKIFVPLFLAALVLSPLAALVPGDDLGAFWKANAKKYTAARLIGPLKGWDGYETVVLGTDASFSKPPFVLAVRKVGGAVVVTAGTVENASTLVLDADGDGILDVVTKKSLVPGWIALKMPGTRGDGKAFRGLADRLYKQYDQTMGPVPAQLQLLVDELKRSASNPLDPDRDLAGALVFALEEGAAETALGSGTLAALGLALQSRGGPHPLVLLFLGEALEAAQQLDTAQAAYDRMLELDPKSTIAAYKKARVAPATLKAFQKTHPDFWASRP